MLTNMIRKMRPVIRRNFITVINQAEVAYRERFGQNRVRLEPGLRLNIPIVHQLYRVSLKEHIVNLDNQNAYTKDNVPVVVSGSIFYRVLDVEKAIFSVNSAYEAIKNVGESGFRAVIGRFDYDEIISNRNTINNEMFEILGNTTHRWGISPTRLEIQNFGPQNAEVARQLEKQMQAERSRRENELQTQADIRTAEGAKQIAVLNSEGHLIAAKNKAEALRYELTATSDGLSGQLKSLTDQFDGDTDRAAKYLLEMKKLEHLEKLATTENKVYFMSNEGLFPSTKAISDLFTQKY